MQNGGERLALGDLERCRYVRGRYGPVARAGGEREKAGVYGSEAGGAPADPNGRSDRDSRSATNTSPTRAARRCASRVFPRSNDGSTFRAGGAAMRHRPCATRPFRPAANRAPPPHGDAQDRTCSVRALAPRRRFVRRRWRRRDPRAPPRRNFAKTHHPPRRPYRSAANRATRPPRKEP